MTISIENAEHYIWGEVCDGWHLLKRDDISIIQERVPAGGAEVMHYHSRARQFFYILDGQGVMIFEDQTVVLEKSFFGFSRWSFHIKISLRNLYLL